MKTNKSHKTNNGDEAVAKRPSLKPLMGLKPYVMRHPWVLVGAGAALVISALAMLSVPLAVRRMIDHGFAATDGTLIGQYFGMLIVIGLVLALASSLRFYFVNWLGERVVSDVRSDVFAHLACLGPAFFERSHSGEMMSRLTADTTQIKAAAGTALSQLLRNAIMLIGAMVMMLVTSWQLSLLVLVAIPAIVLPLMAYGKVVRQRSRQAQDSLADASAYAAENLSAVRTMQAFGHEAEVSRRYGLAVEGAFEAARSRLTARAGLTALAIGLVTSSVVGVLWFGASSVVAGEMSAGRLSQFVLYAVFAAGALAELSEVWGEISQAAGASERLMELLHVKPEIASPEDPVDLPTPVQGRVAFEDVTFFYPSRPDEASLRDVSFKIDAGETVALVGPSGAGKTTIFSLLLRFFDPASGRVLIDDIDVSKARLDEVRAAMAPVAQDVALFADSVSENIRYGTPGASLKRVEAAAVAAHADQFIRALPAGYETQLGERGVTLSGGQRQRIALARALLRDAPILLLDEATSSLDAESEQEVQKALEEVMVGRTTLVIAHRLATVKQADRIIVIEDGRIVEVGTHRTLSQAGGLYGRLAELQFGLEAAE